MNARRGVVWIGLLIAVLLAFGGCEDRDRANPFDPDNPDTEGIPPLLDARAQNGSATLVWDLGRLEGVTHQWISRREIGGEPIAIAPGGLPPGARAFTDTSVVNGTTYEYQLELVLATGAHPVSAWDRTTPGTTVAWFADSDGGGLGRMSADGRDLVGKVREGAWMLDIAADSVAGGFWAADYLRGTASLYAAAGTPLLDIPLSGARALALDPKDGKIWIGSFTTGRIERHDRAGHLEWFDTAPGPIDALVSPRPGELWVACATGVVLYYRDDERLFTIDDFQRPVAFAVANGNRLCILDHDAREVRAFDLAGFPMGSSGAILQNPTDIEVDGQGGLWIADDERGGLVQLDAQLGEIRTIPIPGATGITRDPIDGTLWVAGGAHVRTLLPDGEALSDRAVGTRPIKVALYHEGSPR